MAKAGTIQVNYLFASSLAAGIHTRLGDVRHAIIELKDVLQGQRGRATGWLWELAWPAAAFFLFARIHRLDTAVTLAAIVVERFPASAINMLTVEREELRRLRTTPGAPAPRHIEQAAWAGVSDDDVLGQIVATALEDELATNKTVGSAA